jgi:hypothetical protein
MAYPKRIEPLENFGEDSGYRVAQPKVIRLRGFDARMEKRDPLPVQVYLASLEEPKAHERTVTEDVSPHGARVLTKRFWRRGEVPLLTPLTGDYPKHARIVYCEPLRNGRYCVGVEFEGPEFKWRV